MEMLFINFGMILLMITAVVVFVAKFILKDKDAITAKFKTGVSFDHPDQFSEQAILAALKKAGFSKAGFDPEEKRFYAHAGTSLWSWGEYIEINLRPENRLEFSSVCALPLQLVAWGKNKENARKFFEALELKGHGLAA